MIHGILPINVMLYGLNLFEYFCFIFRVVAVEMVIVGFDPMFQHFEHLFPHSVSGLWKRSRSCFRFGFNSLFFGLGYLLDYLVQSLNLLVFVKNILLL